MAIEATVTMKKTKSLISYLYIWMRSSSSHPAEQAPLQSLYENEKATLKHFKISELLQTP